MTRNRKQLTALAMVTLIVTGGLAGAIASPALADSDGEDSVIDTLFTAESDADESGLSLDVIRAAAMGWIERNTPLGDDAERATATEYATNTENTFNQQSETIRDWTNARSDANSDNDVFRIKFTDESGNSAWLFLVSDVNTTTNNYTSARAMNLSEFQQTNREIDKTYKLSPYASRNADDELNNFISTYAGPGHDLERVYLAEMAGKYRTDIQGDDLPGSDNTSGNKENTAGWVPW